MRPPDLGPQNSRARQKRRKPAPRPLVPHGPGGQLLRPAPRPAPRRVPSVRQRALAQERGYRSQGRAVNRTANRQRAAQTRRRLLAPERAYRSQGRSVERQANRLNVQTRAANPRRVNPLRALERFITRPASQVYGRSGAFGADTATSAQLSTGRAVTRDVQTLAEGPFIGGYTLGRGGYEALLHGDTRTLGKLGKGVVAGVVHSAPGELAQGHFGKALGVAQTHPLLAGLDFAAAAGVLGRVAGAGARLSTGYRVGSTVRPPVALTNDAGAVRAGAVRPREYAKGLERQVVQRAADRRREVLTDERGKQVSIADPLSGRRVPVLKATPAERARNAKREGDYRASRANADERMGREVEARDTRIRGVRGRAANDLVAMVHEGTIPSTRHIDRAGVVRTGGEGFKAYLLDHADRLDREHAQRLQADPKGYRHSAESHMNRERAQFVRRAAASPRVLNQAEKIVAEGVRSGEHGRRVEREEAAPLGVISDEQRAVGSALIPGKIEHLGGRHFTVEEHARLERQALAREQALPEGSAARAAARDERIAVSGRPPDQVRAHEAARAKAETGRGAERAARARVASLERKRQRLVGAQASRRGRRQKDQVGGAGLKSLRGSRASGRATRAEQAKLAAVDAEIKAARAAAERHGMEARKAEHALKRTPMPAANAAIRTAEGKHLPDAEIERWFRERGRDPETVGYLPHVPPGNRAFHQRFDPNTRPVADPAGPKGTRTGEAYRKGATEATAELLKQQHVKLRTQIIKAHHIDKLVHDLGLTHPDLRRIEAKAANGEQLTTHERRILDADGYMTGAEAEELGKRVLYDTSKNQAPLEVIRTPNGENLVPVRAFAGRLSKDAQAIIRRNHQGPGGMESLAQQLLNDRIIPAGDLRRVPTRNVVMVPAEVIDRLQQHLRPAGELERMLQMVNRPFRVAVLSQFRWLTGNFVEPYIVRLTTTGTGINVFGLANDIRISHKILKAGLRSGDPAIRAAARERLADDLGGMWGRRGASNRRVFEDTKLYRRMVARVPATQQMYEWTHKLGQVLIAPARAYFWFNREAIEKHVQHAGLGRSERRAAVEFFGSWRRAVVFGKQATEEATRGLVNTPRQHAFMREQHKLLGQYGAFGPRLRAIVQGPAPFLPWALNAARFVFWTMPAERTIQTALLLKTNAVVADEWKKQHAFMSPDQRAGTLGVDPVRKDQGITPVVRYTPYGLTAPLFRGDLQGAGGQFLPAFGGVTHAIEGKDPFGNDLKTRPSAGNPQGTVNGLGRAGVAVNALAEALIPYLSEARRLREHGETAYPTSNVLSPKTKPGTSHGMSAAYRTLYPFRPTYLRAGGGGSVRLAPSAPASASERALERRAQRVAGAASRQAGVEEALQRRAARLVTP